MKPHTFSSFAFGCRVTQAEKETLDAQLFSLGYDYAEENPEFHIVHTCAVTAKAVRQVRQYLYQTRNKFPETKIIATGCAATHWNRQEIKIPGLFAVAGHGQRDRLLSLFSLKNSGNPVSTDQFAASGRIFVKIQDGCDRACAYCIVPTLRGGAVTRSIPEIIKEIKTRGNETAEVIFTAINTEFFGKGTGETIPMLVNRTLSETEIPRISFGSIHPYSLTPDFLSWYRKNHSNNRIAGYFHVPIQSGTDETLKRMRRGYRAGEIIARLAELRNINPDATIGTDVITGFPGETEAEFRRTFDTLEKSPITRFHVFRYSRREGTPAEKLTGTVPSPQTASRRAKMLRELSDRKYQAFQKQFTGRVLPGLFLSEMRKNLGQALLPNQLLVLTDGKKYPPGSINQVLITDVVNGYLTGKSV